MNKFARFLLALTVCTTVGLGATACKVPETEQNPQPIEINAHGVKASIVKATADQLAAFNAAGVKIYESEDTATLDAAYIFTVTGEYAEVESPYNGWNADYVVTFDKAVAADSLVLAGSYDWWDNGDWLGFYNWDVAANEGIQLLASAEVTVSCEEVYERVKEFRCGVKNLSEANVGTTMTVQLRVFNPVDATDYIVVNEISYTF